jgi:hypothetical protein
VLRHLGSLFLVMCSLAFLTAQAQILPAQAQKNQPLSLYVAYPMEGLEPVVLVDPDTQAMQSPVRDFRDAQAYFQKSLPLGTDLELFQNGELKNLFTSGTYQFGKESCKSSGSFQGSFKHTDRSLVPLLAFAPGFPGPRKYPGAYPSHKFDKIASKLTYDAYKKHGLTPTQLKQIRIRKILPFTLDNGTSIQFAVSSILGSGATVCPSHSLLLVVEKIGRRYVARIEKYRADQGKGDCFAYDFLSSFATGPRVDKILLQGSSRTARWYEILQRQTMGAYRSIYTGGGRSCPQRK